MKMGCTNIEIFMRFYIDIYRFNLVEEYRKERKLDEVIMVFPCIRQECLDI
jgi:hypothetical protein